MAEEDHKVVKQVQRTIDKEAFEEFVREFKNESDRAAVILGAAKLDLLLYQLIEKYLLPSPTGKDNLLDSESALGTFSARINAAYRLGLIDADFARALHLIRKTRNAFAHEVAGCTLQSGAHRDRVREITAPFMKYQGFYDVRKQHFQDERGPHIDFRVALAIMAGRLEKAFLDVERLSSVHQKTLIGENWKTLK